MPNKIEVTKTKQYTMPLFTSSNAANLHHQNSSKKQQHAAQNTQYAVLHKHLLEHHLKAQKLIPEEPGLMSGKKNPETMSLKFFPTIINNSE